MQLIIHSDTLLLNEVENFIKEMFEIYKLDKNEFGKVLLCVNEAVVNSIIHGNKNDINKEVTIECFKCDKYLYFKILDEGNGFDFYHLSDPTCPELIKNETGRGIYLIKNLADFLEFKAKGNIIKFKINFGEKH